MPQLTEAVQEGLEFMLNHLQWQCFHRREVFLPQFGHKIDFISTLFTWTALLYFTLFTYFAHTFFERETIPTFHLG